MINIVSHLYLSVAFPGTQFKLGPPRNPDQFFEFVWIEKRWVIGLNQRSSSLKSIAIGVAWGHCRETGQPSHVGNDERQGWKWRARRSVLAV